MKAMAFSYPVVMTTKSQTLRCDEQLSPGCKTWFATVEVGLSYRTGGQHRSIALGHPSISPGEVADQRKVSLWRQFFSDPSLWWDHRFDKKTPRYPDFKHKKTHEALWIDGRSTPGWVISELASMAPGIVQRSTFSWTAEIERHVKDGRCLKAIELFHQMQKEGLLLHKITFIRVLKACTDLALVEEGRRIHTQIVEYGFMADIFVGSCLIDMYSKCRSIEDASRVFNDMLKCDVACWNAMILGYVKCGQAEKALDLFQQMEYEKVDPDNFTFVSVLNACACLEALEEGKQVHAKAIRGGFASDCFVGSSLVDMYSKCGHMEDASKVFYYIHKRSVVCWNAMIIGYVKCGEGDKALELFRQMQGERVELDNVTFMGALNACASTASLEEGRHVHAQIIQSPFRSDMFLGSCLVDMYVKCGSIQDAITAFRNMPVHDVVAWNGMLMGYAMHGLGREALHFFEQMHHKGAERDGTTFVCLLSACSHTGLESEGHHHFESITPVYDVAVEMKHYNCMVDLLSRAGHLCEAEDMINSMPCPPDVSICMTLLGACRTHGNLEIAEHISEQILALDPENASGYVLLSNIYAEAGKWDNTQKTQELTMEMHVYK